MAKDPAAICNCTDKDIALPKLRINAHDIYSRHENRYSITRKIAPRMELGRKHVYETDQMITDIWLRASPM
jgi:hypothetical protein